MPIQSESAVIVNPYLYKYGFIISNNSDAPNFQLNIGAGVCRDSNNTIDMGIGSLFPPSSQGLSVSTPVVLNALNNGVNGLDEGFLVASKMYSVYIIGDSTYKNSVGTLLSLSSNSVPILPAGYDSYRLVGYWPTNPSVHFPLGYYTGNQGLLIFKYDSPQATSVVRLGSTSYLPVDLSALVPNVNNALVNIQYDYSANEAGDSFNFQGVNAVGDAITIIAQVAGDFAHLEGYSDVDVQLSNNIPTINYKISTTEADITLNVAGFTVSV